VDNYVVLQKSGQKVLPQAWGELTWFASAELGNSVDLTLGQCVIKPGQSNPLHSHPNCSETLYVLHGRLAHTVGDEEVVLEQGDTITVQPDVVHSARNLSDRPCVLVIAFSSADRQTKGE